jgi:hypothetical protein
MHGGQVEVAAEIDRLGALGRLDPDDHPYLGALADEVRAATAGLSREQGDPGRSPEAPTPHPPTATPAPFRPGTDTLRP